MDLKVYPKARMSYAIEDLRQANIWEDSNINNQGAINETRVKAKRVIANILLSAKDASELYSILNEDFNIPVNMSEIVSAYEYKEENSIFGKQQYNEFISQYIEKLTALAERKARKYSTLMPVE